MIAFTYSAKRYQHVHILKSFDPLLSEALQELWMKLQEFDQLDLYEKRQVIV